MHLKSSSFLVAWKSPQQIKRSTLIPSLFSICWIDSYILSNSPWAQPSTAIFIFCVTLRKKVAHLYLFGSNSICRNYLLMTKDKTASKKWWPRIKYQNQRHQRIFGQLWWTFHQYRSYLVLKGYKIKKGRYPKHMLRINVYYNTCNL